LDEQEKIFLALLESHKRILYKVANTYCANEEEKDDLLQEMTLQLWLSLSNYNGSSQWSTWIYRIALNTAISYYRKNKHRLSKTVRCSPVMVLEEDQGRKWKESDFEQLNHCIKELKELDRALIILHLDGCSTTEIAEIMAISPTNVTTRISRVKKRLRKKLESRNIYGYEHE